jgi:hypothetical protein
MEKKTIYFFVVEIGFGMTNKRTDGIAIYSLGLQKCNTMSGAFRLSATMERKREGGQGSWLPRTGEGGRAGQLVAKNWRAQARLARLVLPPGWEAMEPAALTAWLVASPAVQALPPELGQRAVAELAARRPVADQRLGNTMSGGMSATTERKREGGPGSWLPRTGEGGRAGQLVAKNWRAHARLARLVLPPGWEAMEPAALTAWLVASPAVQALPPELGQRAVAELARAARWRTGSSR